MLKVDALSYFAQRQEKSAPPVFIGRQAILEDVVRRAEAGWKNNQQGEPGHTHIIQGAPGAGKSSIVSELAKRLNKSHHTEQNWTVGEPRLLLLDPIDIIDLDLGLGELARLISPKQAKKLVTRTSDTAGIEAGVDLKVAGGRGHRNRTTERATSAAITTLKNWLRDHQIRFRGPIIIAIDEAQTLPAANSTPGSQFLLSLHQNTYQLPISVVLAGLSDTQARASELGLTRGFNVHSIGRFDRKESRDLMQKWCAHFGIKIGDQQQRLHRYCELADDWPRHLHCAQKAIAQVIVNKSKVQSNFTGELNTLTEQDWTQVTVQFAQYRIAYYRERVSPEMQTYERLVANLMESLNTPQKRTDILDAFAGGSKSPDFPLYAKEVTDFFNHLIHQGALEEIVGENSFYCPIPSFRTYLIETAKSSGNSRSYSIRHGTEIYREGEFDNFNAALEWAKKQLPQLKTDQEISLWQGAVPVEILRDKPSVGRTVR